MVPNGLHNRLLNQSVFAQLIKWEEDLRAAAPPDETCRVKDSMKGWTEGILGEIERLPVELSRPFEGGAKPKGELRIMLTIQAPPMEQFEAEFEKLKAIDPRTWMSF